MKISVVMATYNGAQFIEQQLESLLAQTLAPFELILADDVSDDGTLDIAGRVLADAPFPVDIYENPQRLGYADNFLHAAEKARGDYIAFCDQDDVWLPNKLEVLADWVEKFPSVSLWIHRGKVVDVDLKPLEAFHPNIAATVVQLPRTGRLTDRPPGFAMCLDRRLLTNFNWRERPQDLQFPGSRSKHDTWIATLADTIGGIRYATDVLVLYRRHGKNFSAFRKGSNLSRRLGQLRDAFRPPRREGIATLLEGLKQHAEYFEAAVDTRPEDEEVLLQQALRYRNAAETARRRLALLDAGGARSVSILFGGLRDGRYRQDGRMDKRALVQDVVTTLRNLCRLESRGER
ncbi:glycosyltransferase [Phenylobacterium sp. RIFCSPHIGHO2_01_FULL_69_31]|uniref:glycosyltransferase n=1 Tax=Phenylobacterium sp. RIFCSPHIGHO2_01_FULL_69_31 TaxID=1801944 RepID=UPI000A9FF0F9|nr:glycosyltransferase [Phenylobacterium sp. RIFCSPHIGHO2_01_FULL_69_31]